jgi:hypothetical protein
MAEDNPDEETSRIKKIISGLGGAGKKTMTVGAAMAGAAATKAWDARQRRKAHKAYEKATGGPKRNIIKDYLTSAGGAGRAKLEFFYALVIFVHLVDFFAFQYQITAATIQIRLLMYLGLVIIAVFLIFRTGWSRDTIRLVEWAAVPALLVPLLSYGIEFLPMVNSDIWAAKIGGAILAVPIFLLFLYAKVGYAGTVEDDASFSKKFGFIWLSRVYFILLLIAALWYLISGIDTPPIETPGFDPRQSLTTFTEFWEDSVSSAWDTLKALPGSVSKGINESIEASLGHYYYGRVEETEGQALGIYLMNMRALNEENLVTNTPIVLFGTLEGKSFEVPIDAETICYADEGDDRIDGEMDPQGTIRIERFSREDLACEFPNGLPTGSHKIHFLSVFNFYTEAAAKYSFVDRRLIEARSEGKTEDQVLAELKIPINNQGKSSSGPVNILLSDMQPVIVRRDRTGDELSMIFSADPDNEWIKGKIERIDSLSLKIPEQFYLTSCTHVPAEGTKDDPGYELEDDRKIYTFPREKNPGGFREVGCRVAINERELDELLIENDGLLRREVVFTASMYYIYSVEESKLIRVREGLST